jgi:hypothetical protein
MIEDYAERQRIERSRAVARRSQRDTSVQVGVVTSTGDHPMVSINGGAAVSCINLGGVIRTGQVTLVQSDGLSYWIRGAEN